MERSPSDKVRRVELILQQLDTLPALSSIAVRLLELTASEKAEASEIVDLISADPALSAKVLKMCRCHARGRASVVKTVDRAVVLLGFDAVRSAVLSVQVFELFDETPSLSGEVRRQSVFDRVMFWQHSLAVASLCEMIVARTALRQRLGEGEAFISGLLHDLGQLALHLVMPASFDRVIELSETQGVALDQACRSVIGMDSHTAGKRLAEHWHLPNSIGDVLWLHGQPFASLPDLPHRDMIQLVSLADALVRRRHIAPPGNPPRGENIDRMCANLQLDPEQVERLLPSLPEAVRERAESLGLEAAAGPDALLRAMGRANDVLGRLNRSLREKARAADVQGKVLRAISDFHASAMPGGSITSVLGKVVESASRAFSEGFFGVLYQSREGQPWHFFQFAPDGRVLRSDLIPRHFAPESVNDLGDEMQVSMQALGLLPWLTDYLGEADNLRDVRLLALKCGWGVSAILLHELAVDGRVDRLHLEALSRTWGAAIAAATQHHGARRLGEELADTNRVLGETQEELSRSRTKAALGEIAAGAAHEMNNPLAIISGRSQILGQRLMDRPELKLMAEQIFRESHRLSDMITALRSFAEPADPQRRPVNVAQLLQHVIQEITAKDPEMHRVSLIIKEETPQVDIDPDQIASAVQELVRNAFEAGPKTSVTVRVQIEGPDDRLKIQVTDDGPGLSNHALAHAFEPFFSDKPAGRQPGLGLAVARRLVDAHDGRLTLENGPQSGAVATIVLPLPEAEAERRAA